MINTAQILPNLIQSLTTNLHADPTLRLRPGVENRVVLNVTIDKHLAGADPAVDKETFKLWLSCQFIVDGTSPTSCSVLCPTPIQLSSAANLCYSINAGLLQDTAVGKMTGAFFEFPIPQHLIAIALAANSHARLFKHDGVLRISIESSLLTEIASFPVASLTRTDLASLLVME